MNTNPCNLTNFSVAHVALWSPSAFACLQLPIGVLRWFWKQRNKFHTIGYCPVFFYLLSGSGEGENCIIQLSPIHS